MFRRSEPPTEIKTLAIITDGYHTANLPMMATATVGDIKYESRRHLMNTGKDPRDYSIHIQLDGSKPDTIVEVGRSDEDDAFGLHWALIQNGKVLLNRY